MPIQAPVKKLVKKSVAPVKNALPKKAAAVEAPVAKKVAPPKAAKVAKPKKEKGPVLSGPGYNHLTGRLRRVAADKLSDGDKEKRASLTSELRKAITLKDIQSVLELDDEDFLEFLNDKFFPCETNPKK